MSNFIDLGITTNEEGLATEALSFLSTNIEGYEPNSGNLEVIEIEAIAPMAAALADAAGEVPLLIFANYGTQLIKLPYNPGSYAGVSVFFESTNTNGPYVIPKGTFVNIGGVGFETQFEATIPNGSQNVIIKCIATEIGTEANEKSNASPGGTELVSGITNIEKVEALGTSSAGSNPETAVEYVNRLANYLTLQAPRPITALDYANFVLTADIPSPTLSGSFLDVERAVAIDGYSPATKGFEGTIVTGKLSEISEVTLTGYTEEEAIGAEIEDEAKVIPPGTTVTAYNSSTKILTLSNPATALHAKEKMTIVGKYKQERTITLWVLGKEGSEIVKEEREAIQTYLAGSETTHRSINGTNYNGFREVNFVINVEPPTETTVNVNYTAQVLPEYNTAAVEAGIYSALSNFLNPGKWGSPTAYQTTISWLNDRFVRYNKIIGIIEGVPGVDYCSALEISSNKATTPVKTASEGIGSVVLVGPAPLPSLAYKETVEGKTNSSTTITELKTTATEKVTVGMFIKGTGIPNNAYVTEVKSTELKISAAATKSESKVALTITNLSGSVVLEEA
jgi:hypothetical protein